ncbi:MAG: CHAT domain-containing protein [Cyclobacteriaceae bacterium]|nr:CHAT domain-containing protein [Cyclobacteriaceae bacterium]MCH8517062.1 CHAT domain-containing protein [Cyclobacteriaceae bacterium]
MNISLHYWFDCKLKWIAILAFYVIFSLGNEGVAQTYDDNMQQAKVAISSSDYTTALQYIEEALDQAKSQNSEESAEYINALQQGMLVGAKMANKKSITMGKELLALLERLNFTGESIYQNTVENLANLYVIADQPTDAIRLFELLIGLKKSDKHNTDIIDLADIYIAKANLQYTLGNYTDAAKGMKEAIAIYDESGMASEDYFFAALSLSYIYHQEESYGASQQLLESISPLVEVLELEGTSLEAEYLYSKAYAYYFDDQIEPASSYFNESIERFEQLGLLEHPDLLAARRYLSMTSAKSGDASAAISELEQSIARQLSESTIVSSSLAKEKYSLANLYDGNDRKEEALAIYLEMLGSSYQMYLNKGMQLTIIDQAARIYASVGKLDAATSLFDEQISLFEDEYTEIAFELLGKAGDLSYKYGKNRAAAEYYERQYDVGRSIGQSVEKLITAREKLAYTLRNAGRYDKALDALDESREFFNYLNKEQKANIENVYLLLLLESGDFKAADSTYSSLEKIYLPLSDVSPKTKIDIYLNRSRLLQARGDLGAAEAPLRRALTLARNELGENSFQVLSVTNALSVFNQNIGNFDVAEQLLRDAQQRLLTIEKKDNELYSSILNNLASIYQRKNQLDLAIKTLEQVLESDEKYYGKNARTYAVTLRNLGVLHRRSNDTETALKYFAEATSIIEKLFGRMHPDYASLIYNEALIYQEQNKLEKAHAGLKEAYDIRQNLFSEDHPDYLRSIYSLGVIYDLMQKPEPAFEYYSNAVAGYQGQIRNIFPTLSEDEKGAFYAMVNPSFDAYKDFLVEYAYYVPEKRQEMLKSLYNLQLETKAFLLNNSSQIRNIISNSSDEELQELYANWVNRKESFVQYINLPTSERAALGVDLKREQEKINELERQLSLKSTVFASQDEKEVPNWETVRKRLSEDEAAIEMFRIRKSNSKDSVIYVALILKHDSEAGPESVILANGKDLESRYIRFYKNSIKFRSEDVYSYRYFWKDIDDKLQDVNRIYFSPDGVYNAISLPTLSDGSSYLLSKYDIVTVTNTRELLKRKDINLDFKGLQASLFGFANFQSGDQADRNSVQANTDLKREIDLKSSIGTLDPLPGTKAEIEAIGAKLEAAGSIITVFKGSEASESNLKERKGAEILHIATHGYFLPDFEFSGDEKTISFAQRSFNSNPLMRSGLLLSGAQDAIDGTKPPGAEEGIFTAYEAMNMDLYGTKLVVLSACETGLGEVRNGEGVYGLQRAFQVAGVDNILMSLWKVSDQATNLLMVSFYQNLLNGKSPQLALKEAQEELSVTYPDPYYWGAFVLVGI